MRIYFKVIGVIIGVLVGVGSFIADAIQVTAVFSHPVNWIPFVIAGSVLFIGSVFWIIYDLHAKIKTYEDAKPSIIVLPLEMDERYFVEVTNIGESAEFEAQVDIVEGYDKSSFISPRYTALWRSSSDKTTKLKKGQKDQILIADIDVLSLHPRPALAYRLYHYSPDADMNVDYMHSRSWDPEREHTINPHFLLRLNISSEPSMKEGTFSKTYLLDSKGLSEAKKVRGKYYQKQEGV